MRPTITVIRAKNRISAGSRPRAAARRRVSATVAAQLEYRANFLGAVLASLGEAATALLPVAAAWLDVDRIAEAHLDREVALKVLAPQFSGDEDYRRRFLSEARTLRGALGLPTLVPNYVDDDVELVPLRPGQTEAGQLDLGDREEARHEELVAQLDLVDVDLERRLDPPTQADLTSGGLAPGELFEAAHPLSLPRRPW